VRWVAGDACVLLKMRTEKLGTMMLEQNDEWAVSRRYMTLETLGSVSHNPVVSLPALAA
jgi:hypothetical protein